MRAKVAGQLKKTFPRRKKERERERESIVSSLEIEEMIDSAKLGQLSFSAICLSFAGSS